MLQTELTLAVPLPYEAYSRYSVILHTRCPVVGLPYVHRSVIQLDSYDTSRMLEKGLLIYHSYIVDVNECELPGTDPLADNCDQNCANTFGSYTCGCSTPGYYLDEGGAACL